MFSYFVPSQDMKSGEPNYVGSFLVVKSGRLLVFERRKGELRMETAVIIRLLWSVCILLVAVVSFMGSLLTPVKSFPTASHFTEIISLSCVSPS